MIDILYCMHITWLHYIILCVCVCYIRPYIMAHTNYIHERTLNYVATGGAAVAKRVFVEKSQNGKRAAAPPKWRKYVIDFKRLLLPRPPMRLCRLSLIRARARVSAAIRRRRRRQRRGSEGLLFFFSPVRNLPAIGID